MSAIRISDITMRQTGKEVNYALSFKEKIELAKILDALGVDVIELDGIEQPKVDALRIKSIAIAVENSMLAVPVKLSADGAREAWQAISGAKKPRLQVCVPVSPVQMEYLLHTKPTKTIELIKNTVEECRKHCGDVEFIAEDATRSDEPFLYEAINAAIEAGANTVTVCDAAGRMLPKEFGGFIERIKENVPAINGIGFGAYCSNEFAMADACAVEAICKGVNEIKAASYRVSAASLANVVRLINLKGGAFSVATGVNAAQLNRMTSRVTEICRRGQSKTSPFSDGVKEDDGSVLLSAKDEREIVLKAVEKLGYQLSDEDEVKVWDEFERIAAKKDSVTAKELDAIVASAAMQVPQAYKLENYVVTSGSSISATAHLRISHNGSINEGVCIGDGPIDAAFLTIEQITGRHYELDDFQIQAVTEGREAVGQTVVRLRHGGKLYSGRGISTDIIGSGISAYLSALNKIAYEEDE